MQQLPHEQYRASEEPHIGYQIVKDKNLFPSLLLGSLALGTLLIILKNRK